MNNNFFSKQKLRKIKFKVLGKNVKISTNVRIIGEKNIEIGDNVRIDDFTIISAKEGSLKIGSNVHIAGQCYLGCGGEIQIKDNVNISQGVKIYSKSASTGDTGIYYRNSSKQDEIISRNRALVLSMIF